MGYTITEKILARAARKPAVRAGESHAFRPDFMFAYDYYGYTDVMFRQMREFGIDKVAEPERYVLFIDHFTPPGSAKEEELHQVTRDWAAYQGVKLFERVGIGHQVAAENGYTLPGTFVVHFDEHVRSVGAYGCLGMSARRNLLEGFITGEIWMAVPHSAKLVINGHLQPGVLGRDLIQRIIGELGPDGCAWLAMELTGPGIERMSLDGRMTVCGLAVFAGAITAIVNPDEAALDFARRHTDRPFEPLRSDPDAEYVVTHEFDLDRLGPQVSPPDSPKNTVEIQEVAGLPIDQGYIGSCMSGRLEDLRAAARVLKGRRVREGFKLNVVPTSREVMLQAAREGLLTTLVESGAFVSSPTCDFCYGHAGAMMAGQRAVSTGTLNIRGRMGSTEAEIYLASAYTVAATALEGRLADPRHHL